MVRTSLQHHLLLYKFILYFYTAVLYVYTCWKRRLKGKRPVCSAGLSSMQSAALWPPPRGWLTHGWMVSVADDQAEVSAYRNRRSRIMRKERVDHHRFMKGDNGSAMGRLLLHCCWINHELRELERLEDRCWVFRKSILIIPNLLYKEPQTKLSAALCVDILQLCFS